jgi:predicted phage-related endonuclease
MTTTTKPTPTKVGPKTVNFTNKPEILEAIAEVKRLKELEREGERAKAQRKTLEEQVIYPALGDAERAIVRGINVLTLSSQRYTHLYDTKLLAEIFPEAYERVHSLQPYRFLSYS